MKKYFLTDDTALAAYLYLRGMKFVEGTIWSNKFGRKKYVIHDTDERIVMEEEFYTRQLFQMAPLDYHDARIAVSRYLKREIRDPRLPEL